MKEIDWSKAPEGATHCGFTECGEAIWYRGFKEGSYQFFSRSGSWKTNHGTPSYLPLIPRQAPWSGEGLPPVGGLIEWSDDSGHHWLKVEVVGHYMGAVVAVDPDSPRDVYIGKKPCYRPFRTPEQIAAEEREKAIDAILDDLSLSPECRYIAKRVHDAGYRKVTP